jgi:hypothetical protein
MQTFVYMGENAQNASGVSWKVWKIQRKGRVLQVWWGPAEVVKRRIWPVYLQTVLWRHATPEKAQADEKSRIQAKLKSGYKRSQAIRK